jgi:hypothetical protein
LKKVLFLILLLQEQAKERIKRLKGLKNSLGNFRKIILKQKLNLKLHSQKIFIRKLSQGIDFLGYVIFPHHIILRTKTKKRIFKKIKKRKKELKSGLIDEESFNQSMQSYFGMLKHCRGNEIRKILEAEV